MTPSLPPISASQETSNADSFAAPKPVDASKLAAQAGDKKQILVPYSSGDSSGSDTEEEGSHNEKTGSKIQVVTGKRQMSPEFLEHPPTVVALILPVQNASTADKRTANQTANASAVQAMLAHSPTVDRTGPVILDDALLDAAFFATEDKD